MTREQHKTFVYELINSVKADIIEAIDQKKLPDEWDGHELRRYIADRFDQCVFGSTAMRDKRSRRYKNYQKTVLTRGLL